VVANDAIQVLLSMREETGSRGPDQVDFGPAATKRKGRSFVNFLSNLLMLLKARLLPETRFKKVLFHKRS
jgi:hypothetical protein